MNATLDEMLVDLVRLSPGHVLGRAVLWSLLPACLVILFGALDRLFLRGAGGALALFRKRWRKRFGALLVPLAFLMPILAASWLAPWQDSLIEAWVMMAVATFSSAVTLLLVRRELTSFPSRSLLPWAGTSLVAAWFSLMLGDGLTSGSRLLARFLAEEARVAEENRKNSSDPAVLFEQNCAACHGVNTRIVGPALTEIASIYKGNAAGIVTWAKAPGRKRLDGAPMPAMGHVGEERLARIAEYMIKTGEASR
jgi:cytochrome c551/c552